MERSSRVLALPKILLSDPSVALLETRRKFRSVTGRELGFAHVTRALARVLPQWQTLPIEGPDGLPLYLDLRMKEGYFNGGFTNTTGHMHPLLPFVEDGAVVFDVGANIGVWSRALMAQRRLSRLVAFEPRGRNYELLAKNLQAYAIASAEPYAIGARKGVTHFSTHLDSGTNYIVEGLEQQRTRPVQMTSLDEWANENQLTRLDILKVDVEGLEAEVFRGADALLRRFLPVVYFEYLPDSAEHGTKSRDSFGLLHGLGYEIQAVALDGSLVKLERSSTVALSNDFLALPPRAEFSPA